MIVLYKRILRLTVDLWNGSTIVVESDGIDDGLKVTFKVEKNINRLPQYADITIINLKPDTETQLLKNSKSVTLEAGYLTTGLHVIFKGYVRQPIRGKEDATTFFLRLICMDGDQALGLGLCNLVLTAGKDAQTIINQIARSNSIPFDIRITGEFNQTQTERAKVIFGQAGDELRSQAIQNNANVYFDDGVAQFEPINIGPPATVTELNSKSGLLGFPHQVDQGIAVRTLIIPGIKLGSWFHLNNQSIIQNEVEINHLQTLLDLDGLYRIIEIVTTGDTRGEPWFYDIIAISQTGPLPAMLSSSDFTAN